MAAIDFVEQYEKFLFEHGRQLMLEKLHESLTLVSMTRIFVGVLTNKSSRLTRASARILGIEPSGMAGFVVCPV